MFRLRVVAELCFKVSQLNVSGRQVGYFCEAILEVIQLIFRKFHFFLARKTGLKILLLSNLERVEQVSQKMLIRKADNSAAVKEIKFS